MFRTYVDENIAVAVSLLEEEGVRGTNNVGFCTKVGEGIKLLQRCIGSEKAALVLSVSECLTDIAVKCLLFQKSGAVVPCTQVLS